MTAKQKALVIAAGVGAGIALRELTRAKHKPAFPGQVALVTGGSRGLGLELARELAREGCRVVIAARDEQQLDNAAKELRKHGAEVLTIPCDVSDQGQVAGMIHTATHAFGAIDILVNNAGVIEVGPIEDMKVSDFELAMNVMFWGTVYTTLELLPSFISRKQGRIVNISSIGGKVSVPHLLPYTCAKYAITGFSEGLRAELLPKGISVTTIAPGLMRTGAHVNAYFRGGHEKEGLWFALASAVPGLTMSARGAAREIVKAARENRAEEVLSTPAKIPGKAPTGLIGALSDLLLPWPKKTKWRKAGSALRILKSPAMAMAMEFLRNGKGRNLRLA